MNALGKVLVVFVLLLSAGFAASQMVLYAKRDKLLDKYEYSQEQLQAFKQEVEGPEGLRVKLKEVTSDRDAIKNRLELEVALLRRNLESTEAQIKDLEADKSGLHDAWKDQQIRADKLDERIEELDVVIAELQEKRKGLDSDLKDRLADIEGLKESIDGKDTEIAALNSTVTQLKEEAQAISDDNKVLSATIAYLQSIGIHVEPGWKVPVIDAKVVQARNVDRVVVLDKGSKDGVKPAFSFTIYRGEGVFVAKVNVVEVKENLSVGLVEEGTYEEPLDLRVGDDATTRMR